jgi:hypothetical protein
MYLGSGWLQGMSSDSSRGYKIINNFSIKIQKQLTFLNIFTFSWFSALDGTAAKAGLDDNDDDEELARTELPNAPRYFLFLNIFYEESPVFIETLIFE